MNVFMEGIRPLHHARASAGLRFFLVGFMGYAFAMGSYGIPQANEYVRRQDWQRLLQYARAWTRDEPNTPMGWFYLGATLDRQFGQPKHAAPALERVVAMQHVWPQRWNALGFAYIELNRPGDSATAFWNAAQQAPEDPHFWGNHQRAAALGRSVGRNNYERLQNATGAANRPKQPINPLRPRQISLQADWELYARQAWQEHLGAPPQSGQY